jgi:hypothetical protein
MQVQAHLRFHPPGSRSGTFAAGDPRRAFYEWLRGNSDAPRR